MLVFLKNHLLFSYAMIFLISSFDAVLGIGFFAYGEIFFTLAAILAGVGIFDVWIVALVLALGGVLGDSASFVMGRRRGIAIIKTGNKLFHSRRHQRGERFFEKYGIRSVFFAGLFRPFSSAPHLWAGIHKTSYQRFLTYDIPGVIVGIGKFILIGYLIGNNYREILSGAQQYSATLVFLFIFLLFAYSATKKAAPELLTQTALFWRHEKRKLISRMLRYTAYYMAIFVLLYLLFLYILFFIGTIKQHDVPPSLPTYYSLSEVKEKINLVAYADKASLDAIQPVNIIIAAPSDISEVFRGDTWVHDVIFSKGNLTLEEFYLLWKKHTPPVSDLYVDGIPQDAAFQNKSGSSLRRLHVRFWKIGYLEDIHTSLYLGSVSYDTGLSISAYDNFFVPLHEIDPDVDRARDIMLKMFLQDRPLVRYTYESWGVPLLKTSNEDAQYYTDGKILFLQFR